MPRVSLVGNGHGGSEDYATLPLWWAAESAIDYGSQIEAQCLGDCGSTILFSGTTPHSYSVYTKGILYDGANESSLAVMTRLDIESPGTVKHIEITRASASDTLKINAEDVIVEFCRIKNPTTASNSVEIEGFFTNSIVRNCVVSGATSVVQAANNLGCKVLNCTVFGGTSFGFNASSGTQEMFVENTFSFNNGGSDFDSANLTLTNSASEDSTGTITGYTSAELVNFATNDFRTKSTSFLATAGSGGTFIGAFLEAGGGGISVTGDTAAFDFTALAGTVDLTGEILVTGSTASFDYSAISGAIDLTGQLLVTGQTANFDYIALPGTIDLTGEIIVTGSTANFDYTGENGVIELGAVINVVGQTANFDINGVNAEVSLTGEITIVGDTATFDYVAKSGIVVIGEGQKIGTVTAGFADSAIGVQYKQNTITVNFGE
tara:strand:+ start:393 stop:1697 length:1305 start_codon:yes stop_codon:yes gene_type:complete